MDAETEAKIKAMIADSETRMASAIASATAKYVKADSALHVFIREHSQAAFNAALFGGITFGGLVGWAVGHFAK